MTKRWKAEKQFVLDCPVCREPALPQQVETPHGKKGWALIHPGRIATCFVKDGTDAAETIRTDFNGQFGSAYTDSSSQDVRNEFRARTTPELGAPLAWAIDSDEWERYKETCYRHTYPEIDTWEGEGGYIHLATHPH